MKLETFLKAIIAGLFISIGGTVFLCVESKILGALLFSVGLFAICTFKFNLFTGKVCYAIENKASYIIDLLIIWLGNFVGTFLTAKLLSFTRLNIQEKAITMCNTKLNDNLISIFILSIFCNILIYLAVEGYKSNSHEIGKYLSILFGVVVFIMCGFEHCVANMYYFSIADVWSFKTLLYLLVMTLGNSVGGLLIPTIIKITKKD